METPSPLPRPFLIVRDAPQPSGKHAYDVVLEWVAENFPEFSPLFRIESLPYAIPPGADFSLHIAWLKDPVEGWSMKVFDEATRLARDCDLRGIPVVNRVDRLINSTKSIGARLMAPTGVRVPRMARINDPEEFRDTLLGIPLPLLIRDDWGHQGEMLRADTREAAVALPIDRFQRPLAVELIETRSPKDGFYRKYRFIAAGDVGVSHHLQISTDWITRGEGRSSSDDARYEELDYIGQADPNHHLLEQARRALGLDLVAFDYAYDDAGRVVVWEANPYPFLHFSAKSLLYRNAAIHRTLAAILKLYLDRAGIPSPARLDDQLDYAKPPLVTWERAAPLPVPRREKAALRKLRCLGEVPLEVREGDSLFLAADCPSEGLVVLARREGGETIRVDLKEPEHDAAEPGFGLPIALRGSIRIMLFAEEALADRLTTHGFHLQRLSALSDPERWVWADFHGSPASLCLAVIKQSADRPVDQFRFTSSLKETRRFCFAVIPLDKSDASFLSYSKGLDAPYRYRDVDPRRTLIGNDFIDIASFVAIFIPWSGNKDDSQNRSAISDVEGWRILGRDEDAFPALDKSFEAYVDALIRLARATGSADVRQAAVDRLIECNRCPDSLISRRSVQARSAGSLRRALITWSWKVSLERTSLGLPKALEWSAKDKHSGYRLAGAFGAKLPKRQGPMSADQAMTTARRSQFPILVKPLGGAGSLGVFVVHSADAILDLQKREWIGGFDTLRARISDARREEWLVEQYLAKADDPHCPAPDLKFFCFYGRIGLVLEVERYPVLRYAWWAPDGSSPRTGHFEEELFPGRGATGEQLQFVETFSSKLPFPFIRIDFLNAEDGLYFGEFTPRPGNFEGFNAEWDRRLGDLYLDAELRLTRDMLFGKDFPEFKLWASPFFGTASASYGTEAARQTGGSARRTGLDVRAEATASSLPIMPKPNRLRDARRGKNRHSHPDLRHLLITRYNIVSRFGIDAGFDPIDPEWLERRRMLFERFCLPSVARQTIRDFQWIMFVSPDTPERFLAPLEPHATLIRASGLDDAVTKLDALIPRDGRILVSSRIDSDDAIVPEFMAKARRVALANHQGVRSAIAFSHGVRVDLATMKAHPVHVIRSPFATVVETTPPWRSVSWHPHNKIDNATPLTAVSTAAPMFLQTLHGGNVSNHLTWETIGRNAVAADLFADSFPELASPELGRGRTRLRLVTLGPRGPRNRRVRSVHSEGKKNRPGSAN